MTPLFHALAVETTKPVKDRRIHDPYGWAHRLGEMHFFDCGAVAELARDLGGKIADKEAVNGRLAFLPAPLTALEFKIFGWHGGVVLQDCGDFARAFVVGKDEDQFVVSDEIFQIGLGDQASVIVKVADGVPGQVAARTAGFVYGALAIINTPRVIGRKQHMAHAGLQRRMAAARGMVGKFPLNGWTEIVLEVTPPKIAGEQVHETCLSGSKCLHFCRTHLRIRNGMLELVTAHWRGDAALGIKQSRYRLAA